ncbi:MAG: hypothetical protein COC19_03545 [SAR86 cluster bacterium]|uniref:Low temperature requirement protein A n=1 Tax=SAR86 cluster bacterium TaxID=2030880 RepID=A0A2A4MQY0_9GAMM|nr:MAG: hypothetical protein COC19_03545 [SAR86 cluster bacterium]
MEVRGNKLLSRDFGEQYRVATSLELFYDLIFVVAIANLVVAFEHSLSAGHLVDGVLNFLIVFLAIWWAWSQYTWFASSFDNQSVKFRLATLWQMVGALVLASGVEQAFEGHLTILVIGYVIIRSSAILLWIQVLIDNPSLKITARRYAVGIFLCQLGWIAQSFFPLSYVVLVLLWLAEFTVPFFAESHRQTNYHSEHIEERHGLLTIIVLGESILASTNSFIVLFEEFSYAVLFVAIGCIFTLFGIWWLYFNDSVEHFLRDHGTAFQWGYGHYLIYGSIAAIGALVGVNIEVLTAETAISLATANLGFAVAVAIYLFALWFCHERLLGANFLQRYFLLGICGIVILLGLLPHTVLSIGITVVLTVIYRQYNPVAE